MFFLYQIPNCPRRWDLSLGPFTCLQLTGSEHQYCVSLPSLAGTHSLQVNIQEPEHSHLKPSWNIFCTHTHFKIILVTGLEGQCYFLLRNISPLTTFLHLKYTQTGKHTHHSLHTNLFSSCRYFLEYLIPKATM